MRLRARALERRIWKRARKRLRTSKTLWREYRRGKRKLQSAVAGALVVVAISCSILLAILGSVGWSDGVLIALTFLLTSLAVGGGSALANGLYTSFDVYVCSHLPVPDEQFFDLQFRILIRWSAFAVPVALTVLGFGAVSSQVGPQQLIFTACLAVVHGMVAMAVALALAMWTGPGTRKTVMLLTFLLAACMTVLAAASKKPITGAWELSFVVPAGWVNFAFRQAVIQGHTQDLLWALPALAAVHFIVWARRTMRKSFTLGELAFSMGVTAEQARDQLAQVSPELADIQRVERNDLLGPAPWLTGLPDRAVRALMTPREKTVLDFISAQQPFSWGRWRTGTVLVLVITAVMLAGSPPDWLVVAMLAAGTLFGMPVLGGTWEGLQLIQWGTVQGPLYIMYPIGYWELSRVIMKENIVRILMWAPVLTLGCAAGAHAFELDTVAGVHIGLSLTFFLLVTRPFVVGMKLRSQLFDSNRITCRGLFNAVAMLGWVSVIVGAGVAAFAAGPALGWTVGTAAVMALSAGCWASCGVVYNRWRVDILNTIRQQA